VNSLPPSMLTEPMQVSIVVLFAREAWLAVVGTLHDSEEFHRGKHAAGDACVAMSQIYRVWP